MNALDITQLSIEQVQQGVTLAYAEANTFLSDMVNPQPLGLTAGARAVRIPLQTMPSISFAQVNENGGALPKATGIKTGEFYVGTHSMYMAAGVTKREENLGTGAGVVADVLALTFGPMATNMAKVDAILAHLEDNGIIAGAGTGASAVAAGPGTMTFAAVSDIPKASRVVVGMVGEIYSQDLATRRVPPNPALPTVVTGVDKTTNVVTFSNLPAGVLVGDRMLIPGLSNPDPANGFHAGVNTGALVSTVATTFTPTSTTVTGAAATFTGSPYRKGLPYLCNGDAAAKYFTLTRGDLSYFKPTQHDCGAAILNPAHLMSFRAKHEEKIQGSMDKMGMHVACCHPDTLAAVALSQVAANLATAWANAQIHIPSAATEVGPMKDSVPGNTGLAGRPKLMGITFHPSPMWKRAHVGVFCDPANRIKKVMAPNGEAKLLDWADRTSFEVRDAYGEVRLTRAQYMSSNWDLMSPDPSGNGELINIAP
jgi:hypothetical protein